jgi:hypothetical protein
MKRLSKTWKQRKTLASDSLRGQQAGQHLESGKTGTTGTIRLGRLAIVPCARYDKNESLNH